jgi:hypothetical protein
MVHSPSLRFSVPKAATRSWARAVGVVAALVVAACSEESERCNKCSGTDVVTNDDCSPLDVLILYEVMIKGDLYTLVCGRGPDEALTPHDYERIVNCNGAALLIEADVDEVRIRVRTFDGTWSSNGWQTVETEIPAECGCQIRTITVNGSCDIGGTDAGLPQNEPGGEDAGS